MSERILERAGPISRGGDRPTGWALALVAVAAFAVYANSLRNEFVWDSVDQIRDNPFIRDPANLLTVFSRPYWADDRSAGRRPADVHFRPLTAASYIVSYQLGGLEPAAYRGVNLALHALCAVLVALLCSRLGVGGRWSIFGGLVFALHPVLTEAVVWDVGRAELAATASALSGILVWTRWWSGERHRYLAFSALLLLTGLLFKESAAGAVGIAAALGIAWSKGGARERLARVAISVAPLAGAVAAYLAIRYVSIGALSYRDQNVFPGAAGWQVMLTMGKVLLHYFRLLVAPFELRAHYDTRDFVVPGSPFDPVSLAALALDVVIVGAIARGLWRRSVAAVAAAWILAALSPYLHFVPFPWLAAERFLYLATGGYALLVAWSGERAVALLLQPARARVALALATAAVVAAFVPRVLSRNLDWANEVVFFKKLIEQKPDLGMAHLGLGQAYLEREMVREGMDALAVAERLGVHLHGR